MSPDAGMAADFINQIIHLIGVILYQPVEYIYDLLPFHESISQWRLDFMHTYLNGYIKPMLIGFCFNLAIQGVFGVPLGTLIDLFGDLMAICHFFDNPVQGLIHITKGILGFPVYIGAMFGPAVFPPIITVAFLYKMIGFLRKCLHSNVDAQ